MQIITKQKIGLEIECPFSFYFPDLWSKYFLQGKKRYDSFTDQEKASFLEQLKK